jgi:hypothetical protein
VDLRRPERNEARGDSREGGTCLFEEGPSRLRLFMSLHREKGARLVAAGRGLIGRKGGLTVHVKEDTTPRAALASSVASPAGWGRLRAMVCVVARSALISPRALALAVVGLLCLPTASRAEPERPRATAGGYLRVMARPDFQGGDGRLGYWVLHGRLLNESPYAALEGRLDVLPEVAGRRTPWTSLHARVEGGSVGNASADNGSLGAFRLSQLFVRAGNIGLEDVVWQLGTLDYFMGDLGLYDLRPAQIFFETIGFSGRYRTDGVDVTVGFGDSGWFLRRDQYAPVLTAGFAARFSPVRGFEFGLGGQVMYEPKVRGNRFAPHATPGLDYEDWLRGEVMQRYDEANPGRLDDFPRPEARDATAWKAFAYLGFGGGPLRWNNFYVRAERRLPDQFSTETFMDRLFRLHLGAITDERHEVLIGNEAQIVLVDGVLDLAWGLLYGHAWNDDNAIAPGEDNRTFMSTVARFQAYATPEIHFLLEGSLAREISHQGNLFRGYGDSVFRSTDGLTDPRGLEYGDQRFRDTFQLKVGPVISPLGMGVYTRPSFRFLYGLQWSSQINAFGNSFVESLDQFNEYGAPSQRWHHILGLEVEAWF